MRTKTTRTRSRRQRGSGGDACCGVFLDVLEKICRMVEGVGSAVEASERRFVPAD